MDSATSEAQAVAIAVACDRRVLVTSQLSEYTKVSADPSGHMVLESGVVPQRARQADGSWRDLDLALSAGADGLLRPAVSIADVRFSSGGTTPMATLVRDGATVTFGWSAPLPAPAVSGDSATYAEVLPGTDLVVRATRTGFTHVLVVKNVAAAANPALRSLKFDIGGTAKIVKLPDGSLNAQSPDGKVLAVADKAIMWDSAASRPAGGVASMSGLGATGTATAETATLSSAASPGDLAKTAPLDMRVNSDGDLTLVPDKAMLASTDPGVFPIYIDPPWSAGKNRWAYATSDGSSNTDYATARVGLNPTGGAKFRSFFEFSLTSSNVNLGGRQILDAKVHMNVYHTWSCTDTYTHMYQTKPITATMRTSWTSTSLTTWLDSASSHANKSGGCSTNQADMPVDFTSAAVTLAVQNQADARAATITMGFCACNSAGQYEDSQDRWKKYYPNDAALVVTYNSYPTVPTALTSRENVTDYICAAAPTAQNRGTVRLTTPVYLRATLNDADTGAKADATFEWLQIPNNGAGPYDANTTHTTITLSNVDSHGNVQQTAALPTLTNGQSYAWRVRTKDLDNANAGYSAWSQYCEFKVDTSGPAIDPITSTDYPGTGLGGGPGKPGVFNLKSSDALATRIDYWLDGENIVRSATITPGVAKPVWLTPARYGLNLLHARVYNQYNTPGATADYPFTVNRPTPAVAKWGLEVYPGVTQAQALQDGQPSLGDTDGAGPLVADNPLTSTTPLWEADARIVGGQTAKVDATSSRTYSTSQVVDTSKSFSVAAWAKVGDVSVNRSIVSQDGTQASGFNLIALAGTPAKWRFTVRNDSTSTGVSIDSAALTVGRWTHLVGVYDAGEARMELYVDGVQVATSPFTVTSAVSGKPLRVGAAQYNSALADVFSGDIAQVQVYNRVIVPDDFTGVVADPNTGVVGEIGILEPVRVGQWDFDGAVPCLDTFFADVACDAAEVGLFGRHLGLSKGVDVGSGFRSGLLLDGTGYVFDAQGDQQFESDGVTPKTQATTEYGWSRTGASPTSANQQILHTNDSFTVGVWARLDDTSRTQTVVAQASSGVNPGFQLYYATDAWAGGGGAGVWKMKIFSSVSAADATSTVAVANVASPTEWHYLAGAFDATTKTLQIYIDGVLAQSSPMNVAWAPWDGTGRIEVGRTPGGLDYAFGAVDNLDLYQGARTRQQVKDLYDAQLTIS